MMRRFKFGAALALAFCGSVSAADWPQWRGPLGTGITDERNLPERWSATENVAWKAGLAGVGVSSPIVWGDRVFVTSQIGTGVKRPGNHPRLAQGATATVAGERALGASKSAPAGDRTFFVVEAFNRADGRRLWEHRVEAEGPLPGVHDKHNLASPSPVTDGRMVYAWFGTGQIVALDMDGKVVWARHLGKEISPFDINWGHGSSPTLYQDSLILLCDHAPSSYLLAVDKRTGKERWKTDRGRGRSSYTTPFVVEAPSGAEIDRQLERARRCVRCEDRRFPLACRRTQSVSDSGADLPRRHHVHEPRLSQRSVHGDPPRRPRRHRGLTMSCGR